MTMARRLILLLTLTAALLTAFQFTNQKKEKARNPNIRNVQGVVTLPDGTPAEGAVVQLKNLKTLQVRSFITQDKGSYQFQNLPTSIDFELRADFKEFASSARSLSVFDKRLDAIVNLKLEPKKDEEKK
jgi:hypothetical protein